MSFPEQTDVGSTSDLCELADVLPLIPQAADADGRVAALIPGVARQIRKEAGYRFEPVSTATRVVMADSATIYPSELRSFDEVTDAAGNALTGTAGPVDDDGHLLWVELDRAITGQVSVTGSWGWTAVPAEVVLWAAETVADWFKRDQAVSITVGGDIDASPIRRTRLLPPHVREGLQTYRATRL